MQPLLMASLLLCTLPAATTASSKSYEVDKTKVYHGSADSFKNPATIDRDKVFAEISSYKKITKEGLTQKSPRYWILLKEANDVFAKALAKVASNEGYDLIAEKGSVKPKGKKKTPPDVTEAAIKAVKKIDEEG